MKTFNALIYIVFFHDMRFCKAPRNTKKRPFPTGLAVRAFQPASGARSRLGQPADSFTTFEKATSRVAASLS
jgi:hypothetical protein